MLRIASRVFGHPPQLGKAFSDFGARLGLLQSFDTGEPAAHFIVGDRATSAKRANPIQTPIQDSSAMLSPGTRAPDFTLSSKQDDGLKLVTADGGLLSAPKPGFQRISISLGVGIGLAAAVKVTPLAVIPVVWAGTRRGHSRLAARNAIGARAISGVLTDRAHATMAYLLKVEESGTLPRPDGEDAPACVARAGGTARPG